MAEKDEDPDLALGRQIAAGVGKKAATPATEDPDVAAGRIIAGQVPLDTSGPVAGPEPPPGMFPWSWRGMARNVAAVPADVTANLLNFASDPAGHIFSPLLAAGGSAYDLAAPYFQLPRLTPEQRADLAGTGPDASQPGTTLMRKVGQAVGADPTAVTGTPAEQGVRNILGIAGTVGAMGRPAPQPFLAGTGAGLMGYGASQLVPDWAAPGVNLLGNVVGAKLGDITGTAGTKLVNSMTGNLSDLGAAYDRLGIDRTLVGDVSGSEAGKSVQAYTAQAPGSAGTVQPKMQQVVGQFGNAVEDTAGRLGSSQTAQAAGDVLQTEARNWKDLIFPAREWAAWLPVDRAMASAVVDPANYRAALSALTSKLSALPETAKALLPATTQTLLDAINKDVPAGSTMSWTQAQNLRTAIGKVMGVPEIVQSVGKDQLKAAYAGIAQDMKNSAIHAGAASLFDAANKVSTDGHAFIDNTLSKIIKSSNPAQETITPENAAKTVIGSGDTTLQALRTEMPHAADELAAWKLRDAALATPGTAGATGAETSVGSFLTDLNRLRQASPGGFAALYSDPAVAQRVQDLATVGSSIKDTTARYANVSRTGPFQTIAQSAIAGGGALLSGHPLLAMAAAAAPFPINWGLGKTISNPLLARIASARGPINPVNMRTAILAGAIGNQANPLTQP